MGCSWQLIPGYLLRNKLMYELYMYMQSYIRIFTMLQYTDAVDVTHTCSEQLFELLTWNVSFMQIKTGHLAKIDRKAAQNSEMD